MDTADRTEPTVRRAARASRLKEKIATLKQQMQQLKEIGANSCAQRPIEQVSLTDPDARSMATSGRGTGIVGYNVQTAVDAKHHLIVAHEVTNVGHRPNPAGVDGRAGARGHGHRGADGRCRSRLLQGRARSWSATRRASPPLVPKPLTSNSKADGPLRQAGLRLHRQQTTSTAARPGNGPIKRFTTIEARPDLAHVLDLGLPQVPAQSAMHDRATTGASRAGSTRRSSRRCSGGWIGNPRACELRRQTVEHPFGTIKAWMGSTHFLTKTLPRVQHRDEPARAGLQPEARDADLGHRTADAGDEGLRPSLHCAISRAERAAKRICRATFETTSTKFDHAPQSRIARPRASQTLPSALNSVFTRSCVSAQPRPVAAFRSPKKRTFPKP